MIRSAFVYQISYLPLLKFNFVLTLLTFHFRPIPDQIYYKQSEDVYMYSPKYWTNFHIIFTNLLLLMSS